MTIDCIQNSALPRCAPVRLCGLGLGSMLAHFEQAAFVFPVCLQICAPWMCLRALVLGGVREREVQDAMCSKTSLSTSCHVGARSVCSCLRQMTCPAPQGPPVILHPLSPTEPTDGPAPRAYFLFVCV